ncbi:type VII toxin-antitoxin system MntA family adenylyltransferase antitoxin [Halobellus ordinarius]|uniref:type VII toxin-antitoxin system MntA family adenylyltransferase antitoxin n=1 Tax=Halobellus ordinarius TaxID=3075120 RepID=UPI0028803EA5|nr:nucleotidyltransferase domain-containing protein [Halobellus sp. ZY16]
MTEADRPDSAEVDLDGMCAFLGRKDIDFAVLFGSHARGVAEDSSDVDIALKFHDDIDERECFRRRNRIDAEVQAYADGFVDVSDIETLPTHVARAALREGIPLVGEKSVIDAYRARTEAEYDARSGERKNEREQFIERLARGDV